MKNGNGNGQQATIISGALVRRDRPHEATEIERRRRHVFRRRFIYRDTEAEIVSRLAKLNPPIIVSRSTVSHDVQAVRSTFRRKFSQHNFDSRTELGIIVAGIEHVIARSFRDAKATPDHRERAPHRKIALAGFEKLATLYQDLGLVSPRDVVVPDDGQRGITLTTEEKNALMELAAVTDADVTSEAELDLRFGDFGAAARAARDARAGCGPEDDDRDE
jgi:hypothetical protein